MFWEKAASHMVGLVRLTTFFPDNIYLMQTRDLILLQVMPCSVPCFERILLQKRQHWWDEYIFLTHDIYRYFKQLFVSSMENSGSCSIERDPLIPCKRLQKKELTFGVCGVEGACVCLLFVLYVFFLRCVGFQHERRNYSLFLCPGGVTSVYEDKFSSGMVFGVGYLFQSFSHYFSLQFILSSFFFFFSSYPLSDESLD